jgi:hypothetical protein
MTRSQRLHGWFNFIQQKRGSHRSVIVPVNETWCIVTGATYALDKDTDSNWKHELAFLMFC